MPGETEEQEIAPFYSTGLKTSQIYEKGISMKEFRENILRGEKNSSLENIKVVDLAGNECMLSKGMAK